MVGSTEESHTSHKKLFQLFHKAVFHVLFNTITLYVTDIYAKSKYKLVKSNWKL